MARHESGLVEEVESRTKQERTPWTGYAVALAKMRLRKNYGLWRFAEACMSTEPEAVFQRRAKSVARAPWSESGPLPDSGS